VEGGPYGRPDDVPGLRILADWISPDRHARLLEEIDARPWSSALQRRTQHYGVRYDYGRRSIVTEPEPLPSWLEPLARRLAGQGLLERPAEQVLVNEYLPGQGIAPHVDRRTFGPVVATLSLGDTWPMRFETGFDAVVELLLPVHSLAVLSGPSRWSWRHGIARRRTDPRADGRRRRARRVSITFRTLASSAASGGDSGASVSQGAGGG
jgi:alkylated DNA repair dioxygenase AlkB